VCPGRSKEHDRNSNIGSCFSMAAALGISACLKVKTSAKSSGARLNRSLIVIDQEE
jgi:hypothetical protein